MKVRWLGLLALALVSACGGGGGGGGSVVPGAPSQVSTPTPSPGPTSATMTFQLGVAGQLVQPSPLPGGYTASITIPPTSTIGTGTVTVSTVLPSAAPTVQLRRAKILGSSPTPLLFISLKSNVTFSVATVPGFVFSLPSLPSGQYVGMAMYDPTQASLGWQSLPNIWAYNRDTTINFNGSPPTPFPMTFVANTTYVFALVSSQTLGASASPPPTPTPGPNQGAVIIQFGPNDYIGGPERCMQISLDGTPYTNLDMLHGITFQATAGSHQIGIAIYPNTTCTGTPTQIAATSATINAGLTTTVQTTLTHIMTGFTATLSPPVVGVGTASDQQILLTITDSGGTTIHSAAVVDASLNAITFSANANDATGHTTIASVPTVTSAGVQHYDGSGTGPASVTVTSKTLSATTPALQYATVHNVWAYMPYNPSTIVDVPGSLQSYGAGATQPSWSQTLSDFATGPWFDAAGNIWEVDTSYAPLPGYQATMHRFSQSGALTGTMSLISPGLNPLAFDTSGNLYTTDGTSVYEYAVSSALTLTLVRTITPSSAPNSLAVDPNGTTYVATTGSSSQVAALYAYPPNSATFSAYVFGNYTNARVDGSGALYAITSSSSGASIVKWPHNTFGSAPVPAFSNSSYIAAFALQPWGDICASVPSGKNNQMFIGYSSSGSAVPVCPGLLYPYGALAAPIK